MDNIDNNMENEIRHWQERLFSRSIRRNRKLSRILELVGSASNLQCLEISAGDAMISSRLRELGGSWKSTCTTETAIESLAAGINEPATLIDNGKLPFEDNTFDRLVIVDALKWIYDDYEFIHECHRVLKNDAWVIISETRRAPFGLVALLQRMLGVSPICRGARRNGYTVSELFNNLKDGFDVPETIVYSNGLLEAAATFGEFVQKTGSSDHYWMVSRKVPRDELHRYRKLHGMAGVSYPLLWLLSKFEFLPGHRILVKSRRRRWRPRLQPKLIDGRSIAEAAINTKIGTAAPF